MNKKRTKGQKVKEENWEIGKQGKIRIRGRKANQKSVTV